MSFGLAGKIAKQVNLKMCGKYFSLGRELWLSKMLSPRSLDRAKQSRVQTELYFKCPQCFHKTNSAPTQLSFKCQLRKFSSDLAIFLRISSNYAGICTCLWLCELYVYFSCLFEVYLRLFGDGACILCIPCNIPGTCWISDRDPKLSIPYADVGEKSSCSHALI